MKVFKILIFVILIFGFKIPKIPKFYTKDLSQDWYQLRQTETGPVIYKPCDGKTPHIKIIGKKLKIYWQIEDPEEFKIDDVYNSANFLTVSCNNGTFIAKIKWLDNLKTKALWSFSFTQDSVAKSFKWILCPTKEEHNFKLVDNPCPNGKISEKEFLPVDDIK